MNLSSSYKLQFKKRSSRKNVTEEVDGEFEGKINPQFSLMLDDLCQKLSQQMTTNPADDNQIISLLKALSTDFKNNQNDILFNVFLHFNIFSILINLIASPNQEISNLAFKAIINFTVSNVDLVQLFIENGLFLVISDIIKKTQSEEVVVNCVSILSNVIKFNIELYLRRCLQVLSNDIFQQLAASTSPRLIKVFVKLCIKIFQFSSGCDRHGTILHFFSLLLSSDEETIIEYSIFGIERYIQSDHFESLYIIQNNIPQSLLALLQFPPKSYTNQLLKLIGRFLEKKLIHSFNFNSLKPFMLSDISSIQCESFWCFYCAINAKALMEKDEIVQNLSDMCKEQLAFSTYNVTIEVAYAVIAFLKTLEFEDLMVFFEKDIFHLLIRYLGLTNEPIVISKTLDVFDKYFCLGSSNEKMGEMLEKFVGFEGREALEELFECEEENIMKKARCLHEKLFIHENNDEEEEI